MKLKSISIQNFKSLENKTFCLSGKTEIYGGNAVGKSSVGEAIRFALFPSKKDVEKISVGKEKMSVKLILEELNEQGEIVELEVTSSLDNVTGEAKRRVLFDGISPSKPAEFLKNLVSVGTFNPRDLVKKEGRKERMLKLLPLTVDKSLFDSFPILERKSINWELHACEVLAQIEKDLKNTKLNLYQKKELLKKHYLKNKEDLQVREASYLQNFTDDLKDSYESVLEKNGELKNKISQREEKIENLKCTGKNLEVNIEKVSDHINSIKNQIIKLKSELDFQNKNFDEEKKKYEQNKIEILKNEEFLKKENEEIQNFKTFRLQASEKKQIEDLKKSIAVQREESEQSKQDHDDHYRYIAVEFPKVKNKILEPLTKKIPGLEFSESGELLIDRKSIDELSDSETLSLGIKFKCLDQKSSFILADCAECMSRETIESQKWPENTVLLRVAGEALGGDWKSIKIL